ncbi:copper chaperone taha [Blyttiomyces helicus]|uniref:Copper chaperone taha n=1 Tax=Blyttiomyces helicus TaxID=388810 RepID=A0A4P9W765_9FUNG|nr:copper chaperone taha [Blyttiomyces helicus]|eukprot:RKO87215.1 copper chaperone taha [Blyttiomyces helicus]
MTEQTYKFKVAMSCGGCSGAVSRVLAKTEGVSDVDISLESQTVTVKSTLTQEEVLTAIKKSGKAAESLPN